MSERAELELSRKWCQSITQRHAKNFYYGLRLLPSAKRAAMFALYAYMRLADDIADAEDGKSEAQRADELERWRQQTHAVLAGHPPDDHSHPLWPAFSDMVHNYSIPRLVFDEVIAGQRQDLGKIAFDDFPQLYKYCYRVAGVVGLACVYIWGFEGGAETENMAIDRGVAFQLTNILRDLREDAERGRTYLPRCELIELNLSELDLVGGLNGDGAAFRLLMRRQIERAEMYYEKSQALEERISRDSRPALMAMTAIYHGLLRKVARRPERVLLRRVSLSLPSKLLIGWRAVRARTSED
jgi:15-cis-phytoene synthase